MGKREWVCAGGYFNDVSAGCVSSHDKGLVCIDYSLLALA